MPEYKCFLRRNGLNSIRWFLMMDESSNRSYQGYHFSKNGIRVNSFYHGELLKKNDIFNLLIKVGKC